MKPNLDFARPHRLRLRPASLNAQLPALLAAAWLGLCSVVPAGAQVVGFVYVTMTSGYNFVANPFNARYGLVIDNSLTNVLRRVPELTRVYTWDSSSQSFGAAATFSTNWA